MLGQLEVDILKHCVFLTSKLEVNFQVGTKLEVKFEVNFQARCQNMLDNFGSLPSFHEAVPEF